MENTLKRTFTPVLYNALERSRTKMLHLGYHVVLQKSKLKKRFVLLKHLIVPNT